MEYRPVRIKDVVAGINKDYFLPAIQREFVWEPDQIERLFDSIMGDYPIGSFLFWKVDQKNKEQWTTFEFIRQFDKENPINPEANVKGIARDIYLILDGQQRITSLYIGLKGSYRFHYYKWQTRRLFLNLLKRPVANEDNPQELIYQFSFRESSACHADHELWYEVGRILDFEEAEDAKADIKALVVLLSEADKENANKIIGKLHNKIHTITTINYYEERSQDYDKVLTIFVRANSAGTPLEYSDLLLSTATAKWEKLDARQEITELRASLNELGPGEGYNFGKDFVLKASLYLTEDLPIQYKVKNFTRSNLHKIEENWDNVKTYLATTVRLVAKFGYLWENIVAELGLLPIAFWLMKRGEEFFDKSSRKEDVAVQAAIKKWLTVALLKNAFGGSSDTTLKSLREALLKTNSNAEFPTRALNASLGIEPSLSETEIENHLKRQYRGKYTYLVLSLLYPDRDWKDTTFHQDHIFPASEFATRALRKHGYDDEKIHRYQSVFNTVVNLELLTDTENFSKNATPFQDWILSRDGGFKGRHLIPPMKSYDLEAYDEFVDSRRKLLVARFKAI
jgi:Protein of unknown function DUF262